MTALYVLLSSFATGKDIGFSAIWIHGFSSMESPTNGTG
jgi:hypothetical protein